MSLMKYSSFILVLITTLACTSSQNLQRNNQSKNETAYALIKSRQGKYRKKAPNIEMDKNAADILKQIFCPEGECTEQAIKDMNSIKNALKHPKTKHELFLERYALAIDLMEVEKVIHEYYSFDIGKVYPYSVDCKCYNAMALSLRKYNQKGNYLLEINNGLSLDIGELAKVSSRILPFTDDEVILNKDSNSLRQYIESQNLTVEDFGVKVMGHLLSDPTPDSSSLPIDKSKVQFYSAFFRSMKFFVIAHEYSHVLLKHDASYSNLTFTPQFSNEEEIITIAEYPQKEHEADSLAFILLLKYANNQTSYNPETFIAGAELWFMWLDIFQKSEQLIHGYYKGQESHPSSKSRREYIQNAFKNELPKTSRYLNLISTLDKLFEILWYYISGKYEPWKDYIKKLSSQTDCFKKRGQ